MANDPDVNRSEEEGMDDEGARESLRFKELTIRPQHLDNRVHKRSRTFAEIEARRLGGKRIVVDFDPKANVTNRNTRAVGQCRCL